MRPETAKGSCADSRTDAPISRAGVCHSFVGPHGGPGTRQSKAQESRREEQKVDSPRRGEDEEPIEVKLVSDTEARRRLRSRLLRVVRSDDRLDKWLFTRHVLIDDSTVSHSRPVLTLGTGVTSKSSSGLPSEFLHEQIRRHLSMHPAESKLAMEDLRRKYPTAKVGREQGGARNEESTYLHLLVCFLELESLSELVGKKKASSLIATKPYYTWVCGKVASDAGTPAEMVSDRRLALPKTKPEDRLFNRRPDRTRAPRQSL